jgi:uncharacterized protein YdiU (UPF0061 family)
MTRACVESLRTRSACTHTARYAICANMLHYRNHLAVKQMLQYSIETFFPEAAAVAAEQGGLNSDSGLQAGTAAMYEEVVKRTAELVASWQCVG